MCHLTPQDRSSSGVVAVEEKGAAVARGRGRGDRRGDEQSSGPVQVVRAHEKGAGPEADP